MPGLPVPPAAPAPTIMGDAAALVADQAWLYAGASRQGLAGLVQDRLLSRSDAATLAQRDRNAGAWDRPAEGRVFMLPAALSITAIRLALQVSHGRSTATGYIRTRHPV